MPQKNKNISVILAASGKGTRLYTESIEIPKPLLVYNQKPIIVHLIDQYREFSDNIIVSISDDDKGAFLQAYLSDYYYSPEWLSFYLQVEQTGTNKLVIDCLELCQYQKVLISWSDFIIRDDLKNFLQDEDIFFQGNIQCRFSIKYYRVVQINNNPGLCGLYYLTQHPKLDNKYEDFIENYLHKIVNSDFLDLVSLGTIEEVITTKKTETNNSARYFNRIEFQNNEVIKTALTDHAQKLQKLEVNWYQNVPESVKPYLPAVSYNCNKNQLTLEKIKGIPINEVELNRLGVNFWRYQLPELLTNLHIPFWPSVNEAECQEVYVSKPKERYQKTEQTIKAWFQGDYRINGIDYGEFIFPDPPEDLIPNNFTFGHFDLQFSNLMMTDTGELKIIDPRGYFGNFNSYYGDPAYDIAKIYYAIDSYHCINENNFLLSKTSRGTFLIHDQKFQIDDNIKYFLDWAKEQYNISQKKLNYLLFSIWLSLTDYIKNQPLSIIAAYCKARMVALDV